jgi:hypothetical protein
VMSSAGDAARRRVQLAADGIAAYTRALDLVGEQEDVDARSSDDMRKLDGRLTIVNRLMRERLLGQDAVQAVLEFGGVLQRLPPLDSQLSPALYRTARRRLPRGKLLDLREACLTLARVTGAS